MSKPKPNPDLQAIISALETHRSSLIEKEEIFFNASLADRLKIGLHCLKAHEIFAIPDASKRGQGRKSKEITSQRDLISPGGFEGWLAEEVKWLKRPTAYKYMTAVKGLVLKGESLTSAATEEDVDRALEVARNIAADLEQPGPTLKSLCEAAVEPIEPPALPEPPPQQQEFDFLKTQLSHFREETEAFLGLKEQLDGLPDLKRAATARAYDLLFQLTGTHWAPSDSPDPLADIDPDSISL